MAKTLIARISKLEQYDSVNKTISWDDTNEKHWSQIYNQLQLKDYIIFIAQGKLLIGEISNLNNNLSINCSNIKEVNCKNDQLLQLNLIYPELIPEAKANFRQPFIHPLDVNITELIRDAENSNFVGFYIFSSLDKYNAIKSNLKINDRIVLINSDNKFTNVKLHTSNGLNEFSSDLNILISVKGLTIDEILEINKGIKRKSKKSNNIKRIEDIKKELANNGFFKFNTFFTYYDTLYNKRVYNEQIQNRNHEILLVGEKVYKVSMSPKSINDDSFNYFLENDLIVVHEDTPSKGTSSKTQGEMFLNDMNIGDYFYLCRGNTNLEIIGKITSEAISCEYSNLGDEGWLQRSYEIVAEAVNENSYNGDQKWWTPNNNSTFIIIPRSEINDANNLIFTPFFNLKFINQSGVTTEMPNNNKNKLPLNQILYGPPGTGKTFNTINKALEIIDPDFYSENITNRKALLKEFNRLKYNPSLENGQIGFITFHQNFSYEDFIEGIKPQKPESTDNFLKYEIESGLFKKLSGSARVKSNNFNEKIEWLKKECSEEDNKPPIDIDTGSSKFKISYRGGKTFKVKPELSSKPDSDYGASIENIKKLFEENSDKGIYNPTYVKGILKYLYEKGLQKVEQENKPYVLIIDEINRGNVSQIFGELITLIEEDKRQGKDEALEVILPYSKEPFSVPANLYIIGTMNTADRSVEALDTALRRRFSFIEMPPQPELIATEGKLQEQKGVLENIDLPQLLTTINKRIEKLLDKDHQIGHSYFMNVSNLEELKSAFQNKIIPLLQEYFFGDYGKIGLVLGEAFFEKEENENDVIFAKFREYDTSGFDDRIIYKLKNILSVSDDDFKIIIQTLLG